MSPRWWDPTTPGEVPTVPWLSPDAIAYLERLLTPDMKVCEHGSGGSTVWFAERVAQVVAVENETDWYGSVEAVIPKNVELLYSEAPQPPRKVLRRKGFDLLLIDGMPLAARVLWLDNAEKIVKPGGILVLDNANRPELAEARARLLERAELLVCLDGNSHSAGTQYLVTEFYRLAEAPEKGEADADRE